MKTITDGQITGIVKKLCLEANIRLRPDVLKALKAAESREKRPRARRCLKAVIENARIAREDRLSVCQDTGFPAVFIELGNEVRVKGDLAAAVNKGIAQGYSAGSFRASIVPDPLKRGTPGFVPAVIHTDIVKGSRVRITVIPKGFGCENKGRLKMFNPTASVDDVARFIVDTVREAGGDACPPYIIGVGIGGTADLACLMAKRALLRPLGHPDGLEKRLLKEINSLGIGPFGLGGAATALGVLVETFPTHIAGLPVAVSISCHALRSASALL
ncbi:MAG: fumarate hydratase [Deltaproteobacteria bacterium]